MSKTFPLTLFMSFIIQALYYTVHDGMSKASRKGVRVNRLSTGHDSGNRIQCYYQLEECPVVSEHEQRAAQ